MTARISFLQSLLCDEAFQLAGDWQNALIDQIGEALRFGLSSVNWLSTVASHGIANQIPEALLDGVVQAQLHIVRQGVTRLSASPPRLCPKPLCLRLDG